MATIVESFDWRVGNYIIRALIRVDDSILWETFEEGTTGSVAQKVQDFDVFRAKGPPHWVPGEARERVLEYLDEM